MSLIGADAVSVVDGSSLAAGISPSCTSVVGLVVVAVTSAAIALADDAFFFFFPLPVLAFVDFPVAGLLVSLGALPNMSSVLPNRSSSVTAAFFFFTVVFSFFNFFLSSVGNNSSSSSPSSYLCYNYSFTTTTTCISFNYRYIAMYIYM